MNDEQRMLFNLVVDQVIINLVRFAKIEVYGKVGRARGTVNLFLHRVLITNIYKKLIRLHRIPYIGMHFLNAIFIYVGKGTRHRII